MLCREKKRTTSSIMIPSSESNNVYTEETKELYNNINIYN